MTAADENRPQTAAGQAAADDKAAAAARIREQAEADQRAAADAEAEAERKRAQTAAAREARQRRRAENHAAQPVDVDQAPAEPAPCEGCAQFQDNVMLRLAGLERQVQAIGKLVATGIVAGAVIWFLSGREKAGQAAALEGAAE